MKRVPFAAVRCLIALLPALAAGPSAACAATLAPGEVFGSILVEPVAPTRPVLGADGRVHLAYELIVVNPGNYLVTLDRVDALGANDAVLASHAGEALAKLVRVNGVAQPTPDATIPPGGSAFAILEVALAKDAPLPREIRQRVSLTRRIPGKDGGAPQLAPANGPVPASSTFVGAPVAVEDVPAVVIAPPLRGGSWLVFNGCCDALTSHRGAILAINGAPWVSERYAIDFVQLDAQHRLFTGAVDQLGSYAYFGASIHSVADGTVVKVVDGLPEEVPGKVPADSKPQTAGGNFVIVDIGGGNFAFYAHLQPGSLRVKEGDRVQTGDVLALLGNSGNTTAPHLHFHVIDRPSPLAGNGLPYVFTAFTGEGVLDESRSEEIFGKSVPAVIERDRLAGPHAKQLPLDDMVVRFGE